MIVKIKHAETGFGKIHPGVYDDPAGHHPVDLTRCQVACCYMGRTGLIHSGRGAEAQRC